MNEPESVKLIAFYLPQFYPIPENNAWWSKGFTEWTLTAGARALFHGHYQPHIPADLGFYDLRYHPVREAQAKLARAYGIYGFCYYHYWLMGKMILEKPFLEVLHSGRPAFPFCLCWGNHNWTRRWDGLEDELLLKQDYSPEDDLLHIKYLIPIFRDPRYIKIDGKPIFSIYLAQFLPNPEKTAQAWKSAVKEAGFPDLYLINIENSFQTHACRLEKGFDASIEFAPDLRSAGPVLFEKQRPDLMTRWDISKDAFIENNVYLYDTLARNMLAKNDVPYKRFRGVCPSWDNTSRRMKIKNAYIFHGSTPAKYQEFLEKTIAYTYQHFQNEERLIFINAWNEWSEGCHLEPDQCFGVGYLEATLNALRNTMPFAGAEQSKILFPGMCSFLKDREEDFERAYQNHAGGFNHQQSPLSAQLFLNTGAGFSADQPLIIPFVIPQNGKVELKFEIGQIENIQQFRVDPIIHHPVVLKIDFIKLMDAFETPIKKFRSNASFREDNLLIFRTPNPQIYFRPATPMKRIQALVMGLEFMALRAEISPYVINAQDQIMNKMFLWKWKMMFLKSYEILRQEGFAYCFKKLWSRLKTLMQRTLTPFLRSLSG